MRDKIRSHQYVLSIHAEEEMNDDNLTIFDIERIKLHRKNFAVERAVTVAKFA
jgi:hypothetical protein